MNLDRRAVLHAGGLAAVAAVAAACGAPERTAGAEPTSAQATTAGSAAATGDTPAGPDDATASLPAGALAQVSDVPVGSGLIIADPAVVITQPVAGEIHCFSAICTHQGCLVGGVADDQIVCPCHGSVFSATDGTVIAGPATMPLPKKQVTVTDGVVVLG